MIHTLYISSSPLFFCYTFTLAHHPLLFFLYFVLPETWKNYKHIKTTLAYVVCLGWIPPFSPKVKELGIMTHTHTPCYNFTERFFFLSSSSAPGCSPIFFFFLGKNVSTTRVKIKEGEEEELFKNMGNFLFLFSRVL